VGLAVAPLMLVLTTLARRRLRRGWQRTKDLESAAYGVVQEVLTGLRVVKAFGQEDREQERFLGRSWEAARARVRMTFGEAAFGLLTGMATAAGTALILLLGARHVQAGSLSLGDLVLVIGYLALLYVPLQTISKSITTLQSSLVSAERSLGLLDEPTDVPERPGARPLTRATGARPLPYRQLPIRRRRAGAARRDLRCAAWHAGRHRRRDGRGQDDTDQPVVPLLRPDRRRGAARRHRPARLPAGGPARTIR